MPFDPTKPANSAPIVAAELRSQLTSLKTLIDDRLTVPDTVALILDKSAGPIDDVDPLSLTVSNPPTQAEVQAVVDKVNELILALRRA